MPGKEIKYGSEHRPGDVSDLVVFLVVLIAGVCVGFWYLVLR